MQGYHTGAGWGNGASITGTDPFGLAGSMGWTITLDGAGGTASNLLPTLATVTGWTLSLATA